MLQLTSRPLPRRPSTQADVQRAEWLYDTRHRGGGALRRVQAAAHKLALRGNLLS